jgi:hypothetical protein
MCRDTSAHLLKPAPSPRVASPAQLQTPEPAATCQPVKAARLPADIELKVTDSLVELLSLVSRRW